MCIVCVRTYCLYVYVLHPLLELALYWNLYYTTTTTTQALAALQAVSYPRSPHASRLKLLHTPQLLSTLLGLACGQQHLPCLPHMTIAYSTYTTTDVYGFTHDVHACDVDVPTLDVDVYARDGDAGNVYVHEAVRSGDVWGHDEGVVRGHSMHTAALRVIGDGQGDCGHVSGGQGACEGPLRDTSMYAAGHWVQQQEGLDRWTSLCLDDAMMMQQTGYVTRCLWKNNAHALCVGLYEGSHV